MTSGRPLPPKPRDLRFSGRFLGMFLCGLSGQCAAQNKLQRLLLLFVLGVGKSALKMVRFQREEFVLQRCEQVAA